MGERFRFSSIKEERRSWSRLSARSTQEFLGISRRPAWKRRRFSCDSLRWSPQSGESVHPRRLRCGGESLGPPGSEIFRTPFSLAGKCFWTVLRKSGVWSSGRKIWARTQPSLRRMSFWSQKRAAKTESRRTPGRHDELPAGWEQPGQESGLVAGRSLFWTWVEESSGDRSTRVGKSPGGLPEWVCFGSTACRLIRSARICYNSADSSRLALGCTARQAWPQAVGSQMAPPSIPPLPWVLAFASDGTSWCSFIR